MGRNGFVCCRWFQRVKYVFSGRFQPRQKDVGQRIISITDRLVPRFRDSTRRRSSGLLTLRRGFPLLWTSFRMTHNTRSHGHVIVIRLNSCSECVYVIVRFRQAGGNGSAWVRDLEFLNTLEQITFLFDHPVVICLLDLRYNGRPRLSAQVSRSPSD